VISRVLNSAGLTFASGLLDGIPAPEEVIKEKTHESIGHLLSLFDSPAATPPLSDSAASLEKILNP
jgi:hypothetical protein